MTSIDTHQVAVRESSLSQIRAGMSNAGPAVRRVIDFVLAEPARVIDLTVTELAEAAGVSAATVTRTCRILGFSGYQELRLKLAIDSDTLQREVHAEVHAKDSAEEVLAKVTGSSSSAVAEVYGAVDHKVFSKSVTAIAKADRLLLVAVGASAPLAADASHRFATIGLPTVAPVDPIGQSLQAQLLTKKSVCIAVSHTGASFATVDSAAIAAERGATVIAITSFMSSPLTEVAELVLQVGGQEPFRLEALASRMAHLVVLDSLYVAAAAASPKQAEAALEGSSAIISKHRF